MPITTLESAAIHRQNRRNLKQLNALYCPLLVPNFTEISQTVWTLQLEVKIIRDW
jgi:hypothetical protein